MHWSTEKRKINDLIPYQNNPRKITDKQQKDLKASLEKFNLVEIPAINTDGTIIAGHQRLLVMQALGRGEEEIDVRVPDRELTEAELKEYNVRSNKNTGEWDMDILSEAFEMDELLEWGFDEKELALIMPDEVVEDEAPEIEEGEPDSKLGMIYQLGRHTLMCGDATKEEDVKFLMGGVKADMVFTDPPYGINLDTDYSGMKGWHQGKKYDVIIGDDKPFDYRWFDWIDCDEQFWWGADYYVETLPNFGKNGSWLVWDKRVDESKDKMFGSGYEMLWSKQKHQRRLMRQMWAGFMGDKEASNRVHPTQKPTKLIAAIIQEYSKGNIVLDLFGGSGSTLITAEQTGRTCYMMEIDPRYVDVIRKRYDNYVKGV